ncbi:putative phosphodiesterase [Sediminihabitans luteus]|uniref:Putative phosphodiesterase n=1 Tax=Sediminihabitans luteus TaxID=1138585 RepID=A0A2M9CQ37_9CELL|nr:metallophosphoesterase family protein [Sediminihabitans luteus]PJJ73958.1 putative phosphodiesterase [Sediminihabitans luteus]GII98129.1 hypothetical protein Slu03_05070 [Sediminihabitans luteus]
MTLDRLALISDVHGNLTALEAVLDDIASRGITRVLGLGDAIGKGPRGSAVVDRLQEVCEVCVRGNWEDFLPVMQDPSPEFAWWLADLRPDQRVWVRSLPLSHDLLLSGRRVRLLHASARSVYSKLFFRDVREGFDGMFATTELTGDGPTPDVVVYGDVHDAFVRTSRGRTLINVGSVGNPLDEPVPSYVVLEGVADSPDRGPFSVQVVRVPYDVEAEIAVAHALGMPQVGPWEVELRTGVYRGLQASVAPAEQVPDPHVRLEAYGRALFSRLTDDTNLTVRVLPDGLGVCVVHAVRGGGTIFVAHDRSVLYVASSMDFERGLAAFRSGSRTPREKFDVTR